MKGISKPGKYQQYFQRIDGHSKMGISRPNYTPELPAERIKPIRPGRLPSLPGEEVPVRNFPLSETFRF